MNKPNEPNGRESSSNQREETPKESKAADPPESETTTESLSSVVWRLANAIEKSLGSGDTAELRRLHPQDPGNPAFWKLAALHLEPAGHLRGQGEARDEMERRWGAILNFMAQLSGFLRPGMRLGGSLASAGLSELRFVRLLRARDHALLDEVRTVASFLSSKGQPVDPGDIAHLILSDGRHHEESVRRSIARDFYSKKVAGSQEQS